MVSLKMELDAEQSAVVLKALELYARIGTGQLDRLLDHPAFEELEDRFREPAHQAVNGLKKSAFPYLKEAGDALAIRNDQVCTESKAAYDIVQIMKHTLAVAEHRQHSVWTFEPRKVGETPFPKCVAVEA